MIYRLYIGSNNETKKLEKAKAMKLAGRYFPGFTSYEVIGSWQGMQEKTLIIEIETIKRKAIKALATAIKTELHQQAVGVIKTDLKMSFI